MLGLYEDRIVQPLTQGQRDPAPPRPRGSLSAEAVPAATRPAPVPVIRILVPVIMVAAMVAMVALMFMGGRAASPVMLIIPLMPFW
ncbi:Ftsk domain-containing protein [Corynebacterium maris DSM 45190]|uniref:Ftsk domain-containing protein n=1 Tax=Corynebacterium maris DSM 45190 TaxID=1224163 RepID=S5TGL2_9CORY|nr:Ftsk domain-containing protein [Corynebacterium maris DSM 45190]